MNSTWAGVDPILESANKAINDVRSSQSSFDEVLSQPMGSNAYTKSTAALAQIEAKYDSSSSNYGVTHPSTGTAGFVLDLRKDWKSYKVSKSAMYPLYAQQLLYMNDVYKSMSDLKSASTKAKDNTYLTKASNSLNNVRDFSSQARTLRTNIYDYADAGDKGIKAVEVGFTVYFAIGLSCGVAMVVGVVCFACCNCAKLRALSHLGWVLLGLLILLGFLFGALVFPVSVVLVEGCDIIKLSNLAQDRGLIPENVWKEMRVCLLENGDLYTKYNLSTQIDFAKNITDAFALVSALYNETTDSLRYNISEVFVTQVLAVG